MDTAHIEMTREDAAALYREYRKSRRYETKIDAEVKRTYRAIAQGKVVIRALESIANAGLNADGFPHLAICRADMLHCLVEMTAGGGATFRAATKRSLWGSAQYTKVNSQASCNIAIHEGAFRKRDWKTDDMCAVAIVPQAPLHLRPKAEDTRNYHTLWEAEWSPVPPRDPMLLRRIGKADLWVVVAHWDLTEVERAALATRI